jgi:hypothetical protein
MLFTLMWNNYIDSHVDRPDRSISVRFLTSTLDEMLAFLKTLRPDPASGMSDGTSLIPSPMHRLQTP